MITSYKQAIKKNLWLYLGFIFLLVILPVALMLVSKQTEYRGRAAVDIKPENVMLTNIHPSGFTLSWTTDGETTGAVLLCADVSCTNPIEVDDGRGAGTDSPVHYVNVFDGVDGVSITPTEPDADLQTLYFQIKSGDDGVLKVASLNSFGSCRRHVPHR